MSLPHSEIMMHVTYMHPWELPFGERIRQRIGLILGLPRERYLVAEQDGDRTIIARMTSDETAELFKEWLTQTHTSSFHLGHRWATTKFPRADG